MGENRNAAIAAAIILVGFGLAFYFLPKIMLAVGSVSQVGAALVAILFVLGLFLVLWLRARAQRRKAGR